MKKTAVVSMDALMEMSTELRRISAVVESLVPNVNASLRIRHKAQKEISELANNRIKELGLPKHSVLTLYADVRREFGGVSSYCDLAERDVHKVRAYIRTWFPPADKLQRMIKAA